MKPTLTLFCGLPGSGKTTLAKKLEQQGKGVRLCTDDWQEVLGKNHDNEDFHHRLQKQLYVHTLDLLDKGYDVILEDGLWTRAERDEKLKDARRFNARTEMHYFNLSFEEIWKRLNSRNKDLPFGAVEISKQDLEKCYQIFEKIEGKELSLYDQLTEYSAE